MSIRLFYLLLISLSFLSCKTAKNKSSTSENKTLTQKDSLEYQKGLNHAVDEKLLEKYK